MSSNPDECREYPTAGGAAIGTLKTYAENENCLRK